MPRFISATALASLLSVSSVTESASTGSSSGPHLAERRLEITAPAGELQPGDREHDREVMLPFGEDLRSVSLGQRDVCGRRLERVLRQLDVGEERGQLRIRQRIGGEGREQGADGRDLTVEREAETVVGEQTPGARPVAGGLGVTDRVDHVPVLGEPVGGGPVQIRDGIGFAAPKLEEQEIREQRVVAEPRALASTETTNAFESSSSRSVRSEPLAPVRRSASGPQTRSRIEVRSRSCLTPSGWRSRTSASR